jgi:hypothetical protein
MSGHDGKVLSFGPFELSIRSKLLTNGAKVVSLSAPCRLPRACGAGRQGSGQENPNRTRLAKERSRPGPPPCPYLGAGGHMNCGLDWNSHVSGSAAAKFSEPVI